MSTINVSELSGFRKHSQTIFLTGAGLERRLRTIPSVIYSVSTISIALKHISLLDCFNI